MDGIKRGIKVEFDDNDVIQVEMFGTTDDFIEAIATVLNAISIKTNASIDYLLGRVGLRIVSNNLASEIEEEVEEAKAYAKENGYDIDEMELAKQLGIAKVNNLFGEEDKD